jgi:phenylpropionate dioxygenase-like ring-hydroxylating dioxygenase large terminal subunit
MCSHDGGRDYLRRRISKEQYIVSGRFPFPPYPAGWFRVCDSSDLRSGQVRTLHYFGRDLVAFRGADGSPAVLDAFCPHLGAHLGLGKVQDGTLQCRFHGWRFDGSGSCVYLPENRRIPPRARASRWPVTEVNGQIMIYYHPDRADPSWEFPRFEENSKPGWTPFRPGPRWMIRSSPQEILENAVDLNHFSVLHGQQTISAQSLAIETDGPYLIHRTFQVYNIFKLARMISGDVTGPLDVHMYGLGAAVNRTVVHARIDLEYAFAFFITPVHEELVEMRSTLAMTQLGSRLATMLLRHKAMIEGRRTIAQDTPIWERKAYWSQPALGEGDHRIMPYRRWAAQFYDDARAPDNGQPPGPAARRQRAGQSPVGSAASPPAHSAPTSLGAGSSGPAD